LFDKTALERLNNFCEEGGGRGLADGRGMAQSGRTARDLSIMNKKELVESIREDVKEMEDLIKKLQYRCEHLKWMAEQIEAAGTKPQMTKPEKTTKFRKIVDSIYGEKKKQ
jgi:hypothetical protein